MNLRLSQKGWVVIPAQLRKKYDLKPGDQVLVVDYGGVLSIIPAAHDPLAYAAGMLRGESSLTQALLVEHESEREREG